LIDDKSMYNAKTGGVASGWEYVGTLEKPTSNTVDPFTLNDTTTEYASYFKRELYQVTEGRLLLQTGIKFGKNDGAYLAFTDSEGKEAIRVALDNGTYKVLGSDGTLIDTKIAWTADTAFINLLINFDEQTFDVSINGTEPQTFAFATSVANIQKYYIGTTKTGTNTVAPQFTTLRHNYLVGERFVNAANNLLPADWNFYADSGSFVTKKIVYSDEANGGTAELKVKAGSLATATKNFAKADGKLVFESYLILPEAQNGAKVALLSGETKALELVTKDGYFYTANGTQICSYTANLWTIIRMEADTATQKAEIKINGKYVATVDFDTAASSFDGIQFSFAPEKDATMMFDEISVFEKLPEPADYCPEPVVAPSTDYIVGVNVCSLWRPGTHYGWDVISAYPEIKSVLGYYDEGSPEVSDWEIKFMAEHGIDYQIFCWYPQSDVKQPIFRTTKNEALIDGYMNAKYSNLVNFAIMWENTSVNVKSFEAFKNYMVPYWIEYFFKDSRYMKIDNKPILTIWSLDQLNSAFGGTSSKEALDYLREECKKAGFDGCTVMIYSSDTSAAFQEKVKAAGADCVGAYHWGSAGANAETEVSKIKAQASNQIIDTIPTVSVGFDYVGWGNSEQRNGLLDPKDYHVVTDYVTKELLPSRDKNSIYSKMVLISTWNEYGEGTYVMPTARFGFGYLDGVRAAFTKAPAEHVDAVPTESQRQRINYMFDQNRQLLRPQLLAKKETEQDPFATAEVKLGYYFKSDADIEKWSAWWGMEGAKIKDDALSVAITGADPAIMTKTNFSLPAEDANYIKVRMKTNGAASVALEIFFKTSTAPEYGQDRSAKMLLVNNEWRDYYVPMSQNENWKGTITGIRFDPVTSKMDSIELKSIEFVKAAEPAKPFAIDINGKAMAFVCAPDTTGGHLMVPIYPESGILSRMAARYTWDQTTKEFSVITNKHTVAFNIGTDQALVDGKETKLYAATYFYDGVPVVPLDTLLQALEIDLVYHEDGNGASVMTAGKEYYDVLKNRIPFNWEFAVPDDKEDWSLQQCNAEVKDGLLYGTSTGNDPAITSPVLNIKADDYKKLIVKIRWNRTNTTSKDNIKVYFKSASNELSEARSVYQNIDASSNGQFIEVTFDMSSNLQWYDKISQIRIDPFNAYGTFEIESIKFVKS